MVARLTSAQKQLARQLSSALVDHLKSKKPPSVPAAGRVFWDVFVQLSAGRGFHQYGPNPISFTEIEAWARLTRTPLQSHHVQIIRSMDAAFLEHFAISKPDRAPEGVKVLPRGSSEALSARLFDVVIS